MEIDAAAPANNQIVLTSPPQEAIPPIYIPSVEEAAEQAKLMSPRTITLLRQFLVATTDNPRQEYHFLRELERVDRHGTLVKYVEEWERERLRRKRVQHTRRRLLGSQYDL